LGDAASQPMLRKAPLANPVIVRAAEPRMELREAAAVAPGGRLVACGEAPVCLGRGPVVSGVVFFLNLIQLMSLQMSPELCFVEPHGSPPARRVASRIS
jgi:hypothetical protein